MISFKDYIGEATAKDFKAQGYGGTSDRTKFQIGDYVTIGDSQTKRGEQYIGHVGRIIGYKPYQMMVKYAVEFPDGNAEAYQGHMIYGPFKDEATAKKYSKPNTKFSYKPKIDPKDLRGYTNTPLDTKPKLEAYMKSIVTAQPFGMQWLSKPLQFTSDKYIVTILASVSKPQWSKDIKREERNPIKVNDSKLINFLSQNICFYRQNNILTGKLVIENYIERLGGTFEGGYSTPYFINMPFLNLKNLDYGDPINFFDKQSFLNTVKNKKYNRDCLIIQSIGVPLSINKDVNELIRGYLKPYDIITGKYNPQEMFNDYYGVREENGKKYLNDRIVVNAETLPQFEGYYFDPTNPWRHGNKIHIVERDVTKIKIPATLAPASRIILDSDDTKNKPVIQNFNFIPNGIKEIDVQNYTIQSLEGVPENISLDIVDCIIPSLKGIPKRLYDLKISGGKITSLDGGENTVIKSGVSIFGNDLFAGRDPSSKKIIPSLEGLPKASYYQIQGWDEKDIKKFIKNRELVKNLDPETKEDWKDVLGGL